MRPDGHTSHEEAGGDLGGAQSLVEQLEHLLLPLSEVVERPPAPVSLLELFDQPRDEGARKRCLAFRDTLESESEALGIRAVVTDTIMTDDASRARLAAAILARL